MAYLIKIDDLDFGSYNMIKKTGGQGANKVEVLWYLLAEEFDDVHALVHAMGFSKQYRTFISLVTFFTLYPQFLNAERHDRFIASRAALPTQAQRNDVDTVMRRFFTVTHRPSHRTNLLSYLRTVE